MLVIYFAFAFTDDQLEEMRRSNDRGIYEQDFDVIANRYRDEPSGSISSPSSEAMTPSGDRPRMRSPSPPRRRRSSRDGSPRRRRSSRDESPRRRRHWTTLMDNVRKRFLQFKWTMFLYGLCCVFLTNTLKIKICQSLWGLHKFRENTCKTVL